MHGFAGTHGLHATDVQALALRYVPEAREAARTYFLPPAEAATTRSRFDDELAVVVRFLTALNEELRHVRSHEG